MSVPIKKLLDFRREQDGNATIEFVLLFPAFIFLFLTGFESGYYMVRNVMLERAVDIAVRDVRLGNGRVPTFVALKQRICDEATILPDCMQNLQVEMRPVDIQPGGVAVMAGPARCVDLNSSDDPLTGTTYNVGQVNNMMVLRVCALAEPLFPTTGIGVGMQVDGFGNYALVATTAFVNEPGNRGMSGTAIANSGPSVMRSFDAGRGNGSDGFDPGMSGANNMGGDDGGPTRGGTGSP